MLHVDADTRSWISDDAIPGVIMVARKRRFKGPLLITLAILAVVLLSVLLIKGIAEKRRENVAELREGIAAGRTVASGQASGEQTGAQQSGVSGEADSQSSDNPAGGGVDDAAADDVPPPDDGGPGPIQVTVLEITRQSVTPFQVTPGQQIAWGATVSGAVSVSMNATNAETGGSVFANLVSGPDNNGTANWSAEGQAPADQGDWYYSTTALAADGSAVRKEGSYFRVLP